MTALFLICAVVPTTVVAVVGYHQLATELRSDGKEGLHAAGQSIATELFGRLGALEATLDALDARLATQAELWPRSLIQEAERSFSEVTYRGDGEAHFLLGSPVDLPTSSPAAQAVIDAKLAGGASVLSLEHRPDGSPRLLLARRGEHGTWTARIRGGGLVPSWDGEARAAATEFCVLDGTGRPIGCSATSMPNLVAALRDLEAVGFVSRVVHDDEGVAFLAQTIPLTLAPRYFEVGAQADWSVVVVTPEAVVLAPLAGFRNTFTLLASLTIAFASLLSLTQIRRQLVPLDELGRGTRRLAEGDFGVTLDIRSGDDFEALAHSFNQMTGRLRAQFDSLQRMVEIDRSILSEITVARVLETMVDSVGELYPAEVAMALAPDEGDLQSTTRAGAQAAVRERHKGVSGVDLEQWFPGVDPRPVDLEPPAPSSPLSHTGILARHDDLVWTAIPLRQHADLLAVLLLGSSRDPDRDEVLFARQLTAQCAVALANARTLERNRVLAYYDTLTDLPNRLLFHERLGQALRRARRHSHPLGVVLLDLDDFKRANDTLGPAAGDRLLCGVAERLQHEAERASRGRNVAATVARSGGDEFMVLLEEVEGVAAAARFVDRLRKAVSQPDHIDGHDVTLLASAGIAMFPDDGGDLETLVRNAGTALHHAKDHGRDRYEFFTPSMTESAANRLAVEAGLRRALDHEELRVYYQPIVNVDDRGAIGMEALVRWQHPERGLVSPAEFIGIAESTGLISRVGEFVLQRGCVEAARFQRDSGMPLRLAINASPRQLEDADWVPIILSILRDTGLSPTCLVLEITESVAAEPNAHLLDQLSSLGHAGVQIAIDDFGTGYSSLAYLKQFPVDVLKVDRSFTSGLVAHREDRAIVSSIVATARGLGLRTVAEGVENEGQLALLREIGCECAQGNLFGAAMSADEFEKWLTEAAAR